MKTFFRIIPKLAVLVTLSAITGFLLLILVYLLPTAPMEENVTASVEIFRREGTYPVTDIMGVDTRLDNFTDALMLLSASYPGEENALEKTLKVYRYAAAPETDPVLTLVAHYGDGAAASHTAYERYWHGYLLTLKPALSILNYGQIRVLNALVIGLCTLWLLFLMWKKGETNYIPSLLLTLLLIDPLAIVRSLQYSTIYYISVLSSILMLLKLEWLKETRDRLPLFFAAVGCAASFFDLLTWPLASFGIPFCLLLCADKRKSGEKLRLLLGCLASWFVGYGGMWAGKWIIAAIFGDADTIRTALTIAFFRSSMADEAGYAFSYLDVAVRNLAHLISPAALAAAIYMLAVAVTMGGKWGRFTNESGNYVPLAILALLPFLWYMAMGNHSYIHHWFTYRTLAMSAFAILCMFPLPMLSGRKPMQKP